MPSDSGYDTYCNHPNIGRKHVSSYGSKTPEWCPLRVDLKAEITDLTSRLAKAEEELAKYAGAVEITAIVTEKGLHICSGWGVIPMVGQPVTVWVKAK